MFRLTHDCIFGTLLTCPLAKRILLAMPPTPGVYLIIESGDVRTMQVVSDEEAVNDD